MGTRNLTCVVKNGQFRVAQYCQWDGYPSGQGATVHDFLNNQMDLDLFQKQVDAIKVLTDEEVDARWTNAKGNEKEVLPGFVSMAVSEKFKQSNEHLARDLGAKILSYIQTTTEPEVHHSLDFASDSLFCEWAYVIDLDNSNLEVYRGFNEQPLSNDERFRFLDVTTGQYHPIKFLTKFSFAELKSRWADVEAWGEHLVALAYPKKDK